MRAAVYKEKRQPLVIESIAKPVPGPRQILIEVKACGICGSDVHASEADWTPTNIVFGHEFSGVVAAAGTQVSRWKEGDRVVPLAQISCGGCLACMTGKNDDCPKLEMQGYSEAYNGAYAEYAIVGEGDALPLPDSIGFAEAAVIEPLAVGLDAVRRAEFGVDESVLIVGAGPIGLAITQWCRYFGVRNVIVSELNARRLELADQLGATAMINAAAEADVMAAYLTIAGTTPNTIFEVVGRPGIIQRCIEMAEPDSKIVVVGVCQATDSFEPMHCILKKLRLIFTYGYCLKDFAFVLEQMQRKRIQAKPLISHYVGLDGLPAMFDRLRNPSDQIKVIVEPHSFDS